MDVMGYILNHSDITPENRLNYEKGIDDIKGIGINSKNKRISNHFNFKDFDKNDIVVNKVALGVGIVVLATSLAGVGVYAVKEHIKRKKAEKSLAEAKLQLETSKKEEAIATEAQEPEEINNTIALEYNIALDNYSEKVEKKELKLDDIRNLFNRLNDLAEAEKSGGIKIEVSEQQMCALKTVVIEILKSILVKRGYDDEFIESKVQYISSKPTEKETVLECLSLQEKYFKPVK